MTLNSRHANPANVRPLESDPKILAVALLGLGDLSRAEAIAMAGITESAFDSLLDDEAMVARAEREAIRLQSSDDLAVLRSRKALNESLAALRQRLKTEADVMTPAELVKLAQLAESISGLIQRRGAEIKVDIEAAVANPFQTMAIISKRGEPVSVKLLDGAEAVEAWHRQQAGGAA